MSNMRLASVAGMLIAGVLVFPCGPARACNVPVFRYALERWPPAPYEVLVFHCGPLAAADQEALEHLRKLGRTADPFAPIALRTVDLNYTDDAEAQQLWQSHQGATLPWIIARYPHYIGVTEPFFGGPLTQEVAARLLDSPVRRRIARDLLEGQTAVFVLLESVAREKDDAAAALLEKELKRLSEELKVPDLSPGQWDDPVYDAQGPPMLRIAFSVVRLARTAPEERAFVQMLLGPGVPEALAQGPVVFPFFGRGRALCAIPQADLSPERLEAECEFLVGPCSCIVKDQSPGLDMLMAVDWDAALEGQPSAIPVVDPPPVTGTSEFASGKPEPTIGWDAWRMVRRAVAAVIIGFGVLTVIVMVWRKRRERKST
ncbi:MAG: hypothetical protein FJ288_07320 [Planctomycetes bacterium]|nr:hypothetical protein [Planctomycetota bacterium]